MSLGQPVLTRTHLITASARTKLGRITSALPTILSLPFTCLNKLQFRPMSMFTITDIHAGWVAIRLSTKLGPRTVVGSYTPNDAIRDFVDAVAGLATASSATCTWNQEPGDSKWHFVRAKDHIEILIRSPQHPVECDFQWSQFASDVLASMQTIRSTIGESGYEMEWRHPFPKEACLKLEKAILSV